MARKPVRIFTTKSVEKVIHACLPPNLATKYLSTLRHWERFKGSEWTAQRLKALWNIALLYRSGDRAQIPQVCLDARIAVQSGLPKGIEGVLVRNFSSVQKPSKVRAMSVPLRAYTAIRLPKQSFAQVEKARKSINSPGLPPLGLTKSPNRTYIDAIRFVNGQTNQDANERARVVTLMPLQAGYRSMTKAQSRIRLDNLNKLSGTSVYPSYFKLPSREAKANPYLSMCASMLSKGRVPKPLIDQLGDFPMRQAAEIVQEESGDLTFGRITIIQEGGAKGRVVCSPNAWVQFYCFPYHKYLMKVLVDLEMTQPWGNSRKLIDPKLIWGASCATCQYRGVDLALSRLNSGSPAYAVDLSSATDRFPLQLQQATCEELGIPEFAQALEELKGPYIGLDRELWYYNAGQPMGLYGSFPLFHLTHFALLNALAYKAGLPSSGDNFCVLGDDVIIFDPDLLRLYLEALEKLQVPISWHKSYHGNVIEFAGFIITKSRNTWTAYRPYKYGTEGRNILTSPINVLHALGINVTAWSQWWTKAYRSYEHTLGMRNLDLTPFLPSDLDSRNAASLPGSTYFGNLFNRLGWTDPKRVTNSLTLEFYPEIMESWMVDRHSLCQTQSSGQESYLFIRDQSGSVINDYRAFNPSEYVIEDRERKRSFTSMFISDPLIRQDWGPAEDVGGKPPNPL